MTDQIANQFIKGFSGLTHSDISGYIARTLTAGEQTLIESLIEQSEIYFCKQTNRNFLSTVNYVEVLDAGKNSYDFSNLPVKEIISISINGVVQYLKGGSENVMKLNEDFFVYDSYIEFATLPLSSGDNRNALTLTYTIHNVFGADAKMALILWISNFFLNREMGGKDLSSINTSGLSESFTTNVPSYIKEIINSYRKNNI